MNRISVAAVIAAFVCSSLLFFENASAATSFANESVRTAAQAPEIAAALRASEAQVDAILRHDATAFAASFAADAEATVPANKVVDRASIIGEFRAGIIDFRTYDISFEYVGMRGSLVVIMGEDVVTPQNKAPLAGKTLHRRFTDVWRKDADGVWRLTVRQATVISVR
jgi:ketosteroid isomerase-like protein